jgi:hypothetical protein
MCTACRAFALLYAGNVEVFVRPELAQQLERLQET